MYLFLDLETTGLNEKTDSILEVGVILFDPHQREVISHHSWLVAPVREIICDDFVRNMHTENGLWEVLGNPQEYKRLKDWRKPKDLIRATDIQTVLIGFLEENEIAKGEARIAGFSISSFDLRFLNRYAPQFLRYCSHRSIDVTSVYAALKDLKPEYQIPEKPRDVPHRALADARVSMLYLLELMDALP